MPAVTSPNYGIILDRSPIDIPKKGLRDGLNFRVKNGTLESLNLGWEKFSEDWTLNGPVYLIDNFFPRNLDEKLIFGTITDLYLYNANTDTVSFLNPIYVTGTAAASGTTVTGTGTTWTTNATAGDEISFGANDENDPDADWFEIETVDSDTQLTLTATAGTVGDGVYTLRRKFTNATFVEWSFDTFVNDGTSGDDLWFATNGIDDVVTWNGTDATVTSHPELGFTARVLSTYSNMMIYGNITQAGDFLPTTIINSDIGLPLNAGSTGTGLSEQFVTHSGTDDILNMIPIGDFLVIYCGRTLVPIQFIGDPLIFLFRVAISGVGPISGNSIADFGDFHEFIGSDAGYLFDGVTLKETNTHVWRDVLRQTDPVRRQQAFGHFDEEQGDLIWSLPANTDAGVGTIGAPAARAWVEHYLEDAGEHFEGSPFSRRDFPFTYTGFYERQVGLAWQDVAEQWQNFNFAWNDQFFQLAFPLNIAGDENGQIYILNQAQLADGEMLPSYVRTGRMALRSGRERDLLTRIYPFARTLPYDLEIELLMGDHISKTPSSKGTTNYDMSNLEGEHFVTFYRRGRVMEFKFGSADGNPWVLEGWDYDTVKGGMR
jgi:hypothetical protein